MANSNNIVANLNSRVSALEQDSANSDLALTRIVKLYLTQGLTITFKLTLHQYRLCGDTNPLYGAICGTDTYI